MLGCCELEKSSVAYTFAGWSGLWLLCVELILVSIINFAYRVYDYSACEKLNLILEGHCIGSAGI